MKKDNSETVRTCPYCAEQIKDGAKVCPNCRHWLSAWSLRNPIFAFIGVIVALFILFSGFLIEISRLTDAGRDFSPYRDTLSVVESRMSIGEGDNKTPVVLVVVVVTNKSDIAWKDLEFDLRFLNKSGVLIDARPFRDYSTILAHGDRALRIATKPMKELIEYDNFQVYVRAARDAQARSL